MQNALNVYVYYASIKTTWSYFEGIDGVWTQDFWFMRPCHHTHGTNLKYQVESPRQWKHLNRLSWEPILSFPAAFEAKDGVQRGAVSSLRQG